jgi:hypothetical protein
VSKEMLSSGGKLRVVGVLGQARVAAEPGSRLTAGPGRGVALATARSDADWSSGMDSQREAPVRLGGLCVGPWSSRSQAAPSSQSNVSATPSTFSGSRRRTTGRDRRHGHAPSCDSVSGMGAAAPVTRKRN